MVIKYAVENFVKENGERDYDDEPCSCEKAYLEDVVNRKLPV
jgi:hypothetical protein